MAKSYKMVFDERSKNLSFTQVVPNKNTHIFVSLIIEYVQYNIYIEESRSFKNTHIIIMIIIIILNFSVDCCNVFFLSQNSN